MDRTRRNFLKTGGTALASAAVISQFPLATLHGCSVPRNRSFGFQVWTLREKLVNDFEATLAEMQALGYTEVEMCSPLGYSGAGFEPLTQLKGTEMRKIIEGTGLSCTSSHFTLGELREHLDDRIQWSNELGMKQMILSTFWLPSDATVDDYRSSADELNGIARKTKAAGIQMGFHNHHMEFEKVGGELIYDALPEEFDPDLVKMQFQVAVISYGYKAADYFRKYPGRFISAHLADWSAQTESEVPLGQGVVDWDDFFEASGVGGVKNYFVEMAPETFKESIDFLNET